jgi:hypothetical protein
LPSVFYDGCCRILDDLDCLDADAANHVRVPAGVAPGDALSDMEVIRKPFRPEVLAEHVRAKFED